MSIYDITVTDNKGGETTLAQYRGQVLLIVNTATRCGFTPQYEGLDLTYTQYIVMMVLWEEGPVNEKFLCEALFLKSNTLTPLLKKLTEKGYVKKEKDSGDERNLIVSLTDEGKALREKALCVPAGIVKEFHLSSEEAMALYQILYKILDQERSKQP